MIERETRAGETRAGEASSTVPVAVLETATPTDRPADASRAGKTKPGTLTAPSKGPKRNRRSTIVVGGEPRVDLLPPEIRAHRKRGRTAGRLGLVLILVVLLMIAAVGASMYLSLTAQAQLAAEQAHTTAILQQQSKYIAVRNVQSQVNLIKAAQQVGASTEIDWNTYLAQVQSTLPAGVAITTVTIDSASPLTAYAQATAPLQGARVATLSFAATSPTLPEVPTWLNALATLPGFADGVPGSVALNANGSYTANVTLHIDEAAFDGRFAAKKGK